MQAVALTVLCKDLDISLNANAILGALRRSGLAREIEYVSTSGSGEIKKFLQLTESGQEFGLNKPTAHEFKTEPRFYAERFSALLAAVSRQISSEIENIAN